MTTTTPHNDPNTNRPGKCAGCNLALAAYHYTDGNVAHLCPSCDAPHADELVAVVSDNDAATIGYIASWVARALEQAHSRKYDVLFAAMQASASITHARQNSYDIRNRALYMRACDLLDLLHRYTLSVLGTRLEEDRAEVVAAAAEADRAARWERAAARKVARKARKVQS